MVSSRIRTVTAILLVWMTVVALVMMVTRTINIEIFFVLWLIAALVLVELFSLQTLRPNWKKIQAVILGCSLVVFAVIVVMKIIDILMKT